jgi:hypothetical protein
MTRRLTSLGPVAALLLGLALPGTALSASDHLVFSPENSPAHEIAHGLMQLEAGEKIAPEKVLVSEVDLDRDGTAEIFAYAIGAPFYCNAMGCLPRIYRKTSNAWSNVLNDPSGITRGNPGNISVIGMANDGFSDILLGSVVIEWDGKAYREFQPPPVTQLDDAAFQTACAASAYVKQYVADSDATVKEPIAYFCSCLVDLFENAGMPQSDLDIYRKKLAGELSDEAIGTLVAKPADYLYQLHDLDLSCRIELTAN